MSEHVYNEISQGRGVQVHQNSIHKERINECLSLNHWIYSELKESQTKFDVSMHSAGPEPQYDKVKVDS